MTQSIRIHKTLRDTFEFRLQQQSLFDPGRPHTLVDVAESLVGIHSARVQSPAAAVIARSEGALLRDVNEALQSRRVLKVRCVRGTLHYAGLGTARILHAATLRERMRLCEGLKARLGLPRSLWRAAQDVVLAELGVGLLAPQEIERRVAPLLARRSGGYRTAQLAARLAVKELWEGGEIFSENRAPRFGAEERVYGRIANHFPGFSLGGIGRDDAVTDLVKRYVACFGPVSFEDLRWWSGLPAGELKRAIEAIGDELVEVLLDDCPPTFMASADISLLRDFVAGDPERIHFLAWEDSLLKAYYSTRARYVANAHHRCLFNQIGEARAAVVRGSRVIGTWVWDAAAQIARTVAFEPQDRRRAAALEGSAVALSNSLANSSA